VVSSWSKNDELLVEDEGVRNYTLTRARPSDAGEYACVVKNDFGVIQHKFAVDVYGKRRLWGRVGESYMAFLVIAVGYYYIRRGGTDGRDAIFSGQEPIAYVRRTSAKFHGQARGDGLVRL